MTQFWNWGNQKVAWKVEGETNEAPLAIVLIHGFGGCKDHWRFNQKNISSIAPCYALDLIGFGDSSQPKSQLLYEKKTSENFNYCFDNWSRQIFDFCNEIVKKPTLLIGNSIGGVIALNTSKQLSRKCLGVILIDCAQRTMDDKRLAEQSLLMRFLRPIIKTLVRQRILSSNIFKNAAKPTFIEKILKVAYPSGNNVDKELVDTLFKPTQGEGAPEAFRGFINLFDDYLAPDLLNEMNKPVHLVWGEKDPWEPVKEAQKWFEDFECVKSLDIISDAGHCPHDEMPDKVNPIIKKIIQEAI
jgi:pimeloyl-ACP methyl ester carboxylesterase|tara:strand:- start:57 stop:956 length:900 start_codon:yes stop_codon:yes gene_type:complete